MKSFLVVTLALVIAPFGRGLFAQNSDSGSKVASTEKTFRGMVAGDDDNLKIDADADGKSWVIVNPAMLKNHHGQHVQVTGQVADDDSLRITSVKQLPPGRLLKLD